VKTSPAFGQADLTNCERELIHLAGSVQPHGVLLAVREPSFVVVQASANVVELLGVQPGDLLERALHRLGGNLDEQVRLIARQDDLDEPVPLRCRLALGGSDAEFEGLVHRVPGQVLVVELEPLATPAGGVAVLELDGDTLAQHLGRAVQRLSAASSFRS